MNANLILKSKTLADLIDAIDECCRTFIIRENDDEIMRLKDQIIEITDNDYIVMLAAYVCTAEDGDEVIEALYEFVANCEGFVEADEEMTQQVTKEELETVLAECEDKCALKTCIEDSHVLNVAEVPMYNQCREFGMMLYNVLAKRLDVDFIRHEMNRYIPETRNEEKMTVRQLFKKYFYQVVLYQERKPGIYTKFDDHMRRVIILEFYKRIITAYLDKNKQVKTLEARICIYEQLLIVNSQIYIILPINICKKE